MARQNSPRDPAQEITDFFLAKLEAGVRPWVRPWSTSFTEDRPLRATGEPYHGMNFFWLDLTRHSHGYESPYWMTYKQAEELGGQVRKGERSQIAIFYKTGQTKGSNTPADEFDPSNPDHEAGHTYRMLRYYPVFNASQIDGLPDRFYPKPIAETVHPSEHREKIDAYFGNIPAIVRHGGDRAYFSISTDHVQMPHASAFNTYEDYASTLSHELTHWTGGKTRLDRTFGKRFADPKYQFEELVAEMGSHQVTRRLGLPDFIHDREASYIASWIRGLKDEKTAILAAAAKAYQAFEYLEAFQNSSATDSLPIAA